MIKSIKLNSKIHNKENSDLQKYILKKGQKLENMPIVTEDKLKEFKERVLLA